MSPVAKVLENSLSVNGSSSEMSDRKMVANGFSSLAEEKYPISRDEEHIKEMAEGYRGILLNMGEDPDREGLR